GRQSRSWAISYAAVTPLAMMFDAMTIIAASVLSNLAYQFYFFSKLDDFAQYAALGSMTASLFIAVGKSRNRYTASNLLNLKSQARQVVVEWLAVFLFLAAVSFAMKIGASFSRGATITFLFSGLTALIALRIVWRIVLADGLAVRKFSGRKIALIADQEAAADSGLLAALSRHGLQLAHHFILPSVVVGDQQRRKAAIADAISSIRGTDIEEVVVSANLAHWPELNGLFSRLRVLPIPVNLVPVGPAADLFRLPSH